MSEDRVAPRTAAGKQLLANEGILPLFIGAAAGDDHILQDYILAIEAEAASLDSDELRKAAQRLADACGDRAAAGNTFLDIMSDEDIAYLAALKDLRALLSAGDKAAHVHEWIDARNEVVEAGEVCLCGAFRAGNRSAGDKAEAPK